jgi:anti-sigma-K factor RskA
MSMGHFTSETHDCGRDVAAYVLGALEPAEAEEFHRHLEGCAVCRDEVGAFTLVVDQLPMTAPQLRAPRGLRRRIMHDVRAEPRRDARRTRQLRPIWERLVSRPALATGFAAALAALAITGGIELGSTGSGSAKVIRAAVTGVPGSAQLRISGGRAELIVNHLPAPPAGRIYEVWVKRGGQPPAPTRALFSVTAAGAADVGVPGNLHGVNTIMVTQEPAGGSLVPTHPPVIVARLT